MGASLLAFIAIISIILALLSAQGLLHSLLVLPPLARAVGTFSLIVLIWCLAFPQPKLWADLLIVGLLGLTAVGAVAGWFLWAQDINGGVTLYNGSMQEFAWEVAQLVLLGLGLLALLALRPQRWPIGVFMLVALALAHLLQISFIWKITNAPGIVWLMEILVLPLFAGLVYRRSSFSLPQPETFPPTPGASGVRRLDARTVATRASLQSSTNAEDLAQRAVQAVGNALQADIALLTSLPDELGTIQVLAAYERAKNLVQQGTRFATTDTPDLKTALSTNVVTRLRPEQNGPELRRLLSAANFNQTGPTLIVPLKFNSHPANGTLVVTNLHPRWNWSPEDEAALKALAEPLAEALSSESKLNRLVRSLDKAQTQASAAEDARRAARLEADQLHIALETAQAQAERLNADILQLRQEMETANSTQVADAAQLTAWAAQASQWSALEAEWKEQLQTTEAELAAQRTRSTELETELTALRDKLASAENKQAELRNELEPLRSTAKTFTQQQAQVERLQAELQAAQNQLGQTGGQEQVLTEKHTTEINRLLADMSALENRLLELNTQHQQAEAALQLKAQAEADARLTEVRNQLLAAEQGATEWQEKAAALQREIENWQAREVQWQEAETARIKLLPSEDQVRQQAAELDQLRAQLTQAEQQMAAMRTDVNEQMRAVVEQARHVQERLTAELQTTREQLAESQTNALELAAQAVKVEAEQTEFESLNTQLTETLTALATAQNQLMTRDQQLIDFEKLIAHQQAELKAAHEQLTPAQATLKTLQTTHGEARQQLETTQTEAAGLRQELHTVRAQLVAAEATLTEARAQWATYELEHSQRMKTAQAQLDELQAQAAQNLADKNQQLQAQSGQLIQLQVELQKFQSELEHARATLTERPAVGGETETQLAALKTELETAKAATSKAQAKLKQHETELEKHKRDLGNANNSLAELSRQTQLLTVAQKQLAEKERQLSEVQAALRALTPENGVATSPTEARPFLPEASMEVIASLTQELRQPMSSIMGYSELLLGESVGILGTLQRKFLERIKASCERMGVLLNDLIHVTNIDSGSLDLTPESVDVLQIVDEAIMGCSEQYRDKSISLRLDVKDDLPPISADRDSLRQILTHLLANAGNACGPEGEVVLRITEENAPGFAGEPEPALKVAVKDTGGGIAPEDQPRVFGRFYRADAPLIAGLGESGVGLSVAKALVEAHGGRIWLMSEPGVGSTFNVLLPVHTHPVNGLSNGH
ncbi:MAG: GAF domain-containing protein [Anaerolineales bacterium]|nr:GAF domain-containing protein [Anaerolineales bacterium]